MTRFIWVRDRDKMEHYINVNHIVRVTKVHIVLNEGVDSTRAIWLSPDSFDTLEDVVAKIQVAMA
jgi:hypothetical protein